MSPLRTILLHCTSERNTVPLQPSHQSKCWHIGFYRRIQCQHFFLATSLLLKSFIYIEQAKFRPFIVERSHIVSLNNVYEFLAAVKLDGGSDFMKVSCRRAWNLCSWMSGFLKSTKQSKHEIVHFISTLTPFSAPGTETSTFDLSERSASTLFDARRTFLHLPV